MSSKNANRFKLLGIGGIFFAPLILAYVFYSGPDSWKPSGTTAVGQLVTPARPMPEFDFRLPDGSTEPMREIWTVLHVAQSACGEDCEHRLWETRQMHTLLHRRRDRVQRAILVMDDTEVGPLWKKLQPQHPYLKVLGLTPEEHQKFTAWMGDLKVHEPVILIDPLGNFVLYYGDELPHQGMLKDIKRVLKLSSIG